jgi:hypothetical protein
MNSVRWLIRILLLVGLSACTATPPGDQRQAVVPLTIPPYPTAQGSISTPLMLEKNILSGTQTTFDTTDTPESMRTWYSTTLQGMGWTEGMTPDNSWLDFLDLRGCPYASARVFVSTPTPRSTHIRVVYKTLACRDWPPAPTR